MSRFGQPASAIAAALAVAASCAAFAADPAGSPGASSGASPYAEGAATFAASCAVCHGAKGSGTPSLAPPLTSNPARYATIPEGRRQLAMTVLNGMFGGIEVDGKHFDFKMPEFTQLDDAALAAVLNFVVFDLANAAPQTRPMTAPEIAAERAHPLDGTAVREHRAKVLAALGS